MEWLSDTGPISELLAQLDPRYRPTLEIVIVVGGGLFLLAQVVNPILDLGHRILRLVHWITGALAWLWNKTFRAKTPPPPPAPARTIPSERTIWELRAPAEAISPLTNGIPIITVAAMKGGVGKTTIAANLAVYFRRTRSKPVLLIDLDYQGSLSECIRGEAGYTDRDITSDILLRPESEFPNPELYARPMRRRVEDVYLYPADYPLATIENDLLIEWVCPERKQPTSNDELMYRLCRHLRRPAFQERFGVVIIDSPPRLTTGSINALCGSTHLLVPATLDDMSAQAAEYFLRQIHRMQNAPQSVFPKLRVIGIVPSIVSGEGALQAQELRAVDRLKAYGSSPHWGREDFVLEEARIPRRAEVARAAGLGVASLRGHAAEQIFDRLGRAIDARLMRLK